MERFLLSAGLGVFLLTGCMASRGIQGIPHAFLKTPSLQIRGEIIRYRGVQSVQVMQHTGYGGVDAFLLLRDPFFKELLEKDYYKNFLWGIWVVSVPIDDGKFEHLFQSTSFYGAIPPSDYSLLSFIALIVRLSDDPDRIFGIEFDGSFPTLYKFNRTAWQFEAIQNTGTKPIITVDVSPENPAVKDVRNVSIKIEY